MTKMCVIGKKETWSLDVEKILFVRQEGKMVTIFTENNSISQRNNLDNLMNKLGNSFFRCHKYCAVNFERVFGIKDTYIIFDNGQSISMGINYLRNTRRAFHSYIDTIETSEIKETN